MNQRLALASFLVALVISVSGTAHGAHSDPPPDAAEDALQDERADGDVDDEDIALASVADPRYPAPRQEPSWVSLVAFTKSISSRQNDVGAMVVVGLPLDRMTAETHSLADPTPPPRPVPVAAATSAPNPPRTIAYALARQCVGAALRSAGLGQGDARLDALIARSRASAWLPDMRLRAMRLLTDASHATTLATTDGTTYYEAAGANLVLEARLTWRLDRLLYGGDELAVERMRLERQQERSRLVERTLDVLFTWQRALSDVRASLAGSREEFEARLRATEAEVKLDILTGGWFSKRESDAPEDP